MRRDASLLFSLFLGFAGFNPTASIADEPAHDLVIRHGKIVDGTGNPWYYGDVAVRGDKIVGHRARCWGRPSGRSTPAA